MTPRANPAPVHPRPILAVSRGALLLALALAGLAAGLLMVGAGGCVNAEVARTATQARTAFEAFEKFSRPRTLDKAAIAEYERLAAEVRAALEGHEAAAKGAAK